MVAIRNLSMASDLADFVYPEIKYEDVHTSDETLIAAARILLAKRGFPLKIEGRTLGFREDSSYEDLKKRFELFFPMKDDELHIVAFESGYDTMIRHIEPEMFGDGFVRIKPVGVYIAKRLMCKEVVVMCNTQRHITVVILETVNVEAEHTIASILPALLPWVFKEQPRTKEEETALMTLGDFSSGTAKITEQLEELSECYDIDDLAADFYLKDFSSNVREELRLKTIRHLDRLAEQIDEAHARMRDLISERYEHQAFLTGLEMSVGNDDSLIECFKNNEKLQVVGRNGNSITYIIAGYMDLFDTEAYASIRATKESYLYEAYGNVNKPPISYDDYLLLMDALFQDELVKLKLCSAWTLSPFEIGCVSRYKFPSRYDNYLPNSHLQEYGCYGSFRADLDKAIEKQNYEYAVDISSVENGNINLGDSVVIPQSFIPSVLRSENKIIELPYGRSVTVVEAVEWIKEVNDGKDN